MTTLGDADPPDRRGSPSEFAVAGAPNTDRSSPLRWILSHLGRYPHLVIGFVAAVLLQSVASAAIPRLTGVGFDVVSGAVDGISLAAVAAGIAAIAVVQGVTDLGSSYLIEVMGQRLERDARDELYVSLLGKSQTFHNRQRVGDIMARVANDVRQLNGMMNPGVSLIVSSGLGIVVPTAFIAAIDPRLLLAPAAFVIAFVPALRSYMRQLNPVSVALRAQFGAMNAGLNESITGIEVVKSSVAEGTERRAFADNAAKYRDHFVQQGQIQARYLPLLLIGLAVALGFAHGMYLLSAGEITTGELVAYLGLLGALRFPAFISIFTFSLVQLGMAGAARILQLMREETEIDENAAGHAAALTGAIAFEGVSFGYGGDKLAVDQVSFDIPPGCTVAIVGQTGSGKSTLTKLVNRTYDATAGQIRVDGVDVRAWNLQSLRSQISVIEQDVFLFSRSIADNIAFGLGEAATRPAIEAAARAAQAHDFITGFDKGYDTVIGERGVTLSGGQRQRIAIARALLTDPRILVIDDATSAVDSATEDAIQRAINAVLRGRTTFIITHRLSQIRRADRVLVMHRGALVDRGTHAELLQRCALYQRIFARYDASPG